MAAEPGKRVTRTFDAGNPAYRWRLWVRGKYHDRRFVHVYWGKVAVALTALLGAAWLALAGSIWAEAKYHRGFGEARYRDLALPWRWPRYRAELGLHYLRLGGSEWEHGLYVRAMGDLESAFRLDPSNLGGRRMLALIRRRSGHEAEAHALLRAGVAEAAAQNNVPYLRDYFRDVFERQADDEALSVSRGLLPPVVDLGMVHQFTAFQEATALYNRRRYAEALRVMAAWQLGAFPDGNLLGAACLWESGQQGLAMRRLKIGIRRFPTDDAIYLRLEAYAREHGDLDQVREYALLGSLARPASPSAQIELIRADQSLGRRADADREVVAFCAQFKGDVRALSLLAELGADTGQVPLAVRARNLALGGGYRGFAFDVSMVSARLQNRDYSGALAEIKAVEARKPAQDPPLDAVLSGARAVCLFGLGQGGGDLGFSNFLPMAGALPPPAAVSLSNQLARAGAAPQARELLQRVCDLNPNYEPAWANLVHSQTEARDLPGLRRNLPGFLRLRRPTADVLRAASALLDPKKDKALRAQIAAALAP